MEDKNPVDIFWSEAGWNLKDCCIEPLIQLEDLGDRLRVSMDLPGVEKEGIDVSVTENTLEVKAVMQKTCKFCRWGTIQRSVEFRSFHKSLILPYSIDPENTSSKFKQGILEIMLPKKHVKTSVEIE